MSVTYRGRCEQAANLAEALMRRGWNVTGYKEDRSDSMTDYYDPASWTAPATRNGFVLVPGVGSNRDYDVPKGKGWALFRDGKRLTCGNLPQGDTYGNAGKASAEAVAEKIGRLIGDPSPWSAVAGGLRRFDALLTATQRLASIRHYAEQASNAAYCHNDDERRQSVVPAARFMARFGTVHYADRCDTFSRKIVTLREKAEALFAEVFPPRPTFRIVQEA